MPLPGIRAAKFMVDEMQRDLLETEDQHLDGFFDRWTAAGLPEIEEYRGDRIRSRGEMISETTKIGRVIEKRPELLQEEDTGESPILTGVKRIARGAERFQGMMGNSGAAAPTLMQASSPAAEDNVDTPTVNAPPPVLQPAPVSPRPTADVDPGIRGMGAQVLPLPVAPTGEPDVTRLRVNQLYSTQDGKTARFNGRELAPHADPFEEAARQHAGRQELARLEQERTNQEARTQRAQEMLPGVGQPATLQEVYDRLDAGETPRELGLTNAGNPFAPAGLAYHRALRSNSPSKAALRQRTLPTLDEAADNLRETVGEFEAFTGTIDKRRDIHPAAHDQFVRQGQSTVTARQREFEDALISDRAERTNAFKTERTETEAAVREKINTLRNEARELENRIAPFFDDTNSGKEMPIWARNGLAIVRSRRSIADYLEQNLPTAGAQAEARFVEAQDVRERTAKHNAKHSQLDNFGNEFQANGTELVSAWNALGFDGLTAEIGTARANLKEAQAELESLRRAGVQGIKIEQLNIFAEHLRKSIPELEEERDTKLANLSQNIQAIRSIPRSPAASAAREAWNNGEYGKMVDFIGMDPVGTLTRLVAEELTVNLPSTAAGVAGGVLTGLVGGAVASGATTALFEYSAGLIAEIENFGGNFGDTESVKRVMNEHGDEIRSRVSKRAAAMGLTAGIADAAGGVIADLIKVPGVPAAGPGARNSFSPRDVGNAIVGEAASRSIELGGGKIIEQQIDRQ